MNVTFNDAALAALCSSERRLTQRWGSEVGRTVARRLLDLAAVNAATIDRLPGARVNKDGSGETVVTFGDAIVVRGIISNATDDSRGPRADADHMMITRLDVHGSEQR